MPESDQKPYIKTARDHAVDAGLIMDHVGGAEDDTARIMLLAEAQAAALTAIALTLTDAPTVDWRFNDRRLVAEPVPPPRRGPPDA